MKQIGVLISGRGTNLQALIDAQAGGDLGGEIAVVLSNKTKALGLKRAQDAHIPTEVVTKKLHRNRNEFDRAVMSVLKRYKVDLVVLAGYMRILSDEFIREFENRIINIHPSLLPSFKGLKAQWQAVEHGVRISGCSTHFVTQKMDSGPVILQKAVPVFEEDTGETLASRILPEEHRLLIRSVRLYCQDRLSISEGRVIIEEK
ncbi:MAG: phosphoribosylglycinamide formyltransferase [Promethearchaeota archaeon]